MICAMACCLSTDITVDESRRFEDKAHYVRALLRMMQGRKADPSVVILDVDGRVLQSTPESGKRACYNGYRRKEGGKIYIETRKI
jgi:hypothetical protein